MIVSQITDTYREVAIASPTFDLLAGNIRLVVSRWAEYKDAGGDWKMVPNSLRPHARERIVDNNTFVNPATSVICGPEDPRAVAAYNYFIGSTPATLGLAALDQMIYPAIAMQVERYLTANTLLGE